jgi:lycopene cyclase domain-containing protein
MLNAENTDQVATYLLINLLSISIPLVLSFDKKVHYYKRWKYLLPAIFLTLLIFIIWDIYFTHIGIWGFNPLHLSGIEIVNLPLGEWLFFITVPYSSVFLYDVYKAYVKKDLLARAAPKISAFLMGFLLFMGLANTDRLYTSVTFISLAVFIGLVQYVFRLGFMGRFYLSYAVVLIPFLIVNGVLTGSYIPEEVVWYNDEENLSRRIFTIPVEDIFYGMLLILMNVFFYELFMKKKDNSQTRQWSLW